VNNPAIQSTWSHFIRRGALGAMLYGFFDSVGVTLTAQLHQSPMEIGLVALVSLAACGAFGASSMAVLGLSGKLRSSNRTIPFAAGFFALALVAFGEFWFTDPPPFQEPFYMQGNVRVFAAISIVTSLSLLMFFVTSSARARRIAMQLMVVVAIVPMFFGELPEIQERTSESEAPNILLVTLDTTRADRFMDGSVDVPAFNRIAKEGVRFDTAVSQIPVTGPAHATILSGRTPWENEMLLNGELVNSSLPWLPEALRSQGYETGAFVSAWVLLKNLGFNRGFDVYDDDFGSIKGLGAVLPGRMWEMTKRHLEGVAYLLERRGDNTVDDALRWLSSREKELPWFAWVHLFDAHGPYEPPVPFDERYYRGSDPRDPANDSMSELNHLPPYLMKSLEGITDTDWVIAQYDGEIAFADQQLGRLLAFLDSTKQTENTIVVVVGDHGEGLGEEDEWFDHGDWLFEHDLHVPFAMRYPGKIVPNSVVKNPVELTDITPTILGYLDLEMEGTTGVSLRSAISFNEVPRLFARSMAFDRAPNRAQRKIDKSFQPTYRQAGLRVPGHRYIHREAADYDHILFTCGAKGTPGCARVDLLDTDIVSLFATEAETLLSADVGVRRQTSGDEAKMLEMLGYIDPTESK
jgi:arylsulfatase A-like enzyme